MGSVSNIAMAPSQYKALPYDAAKDFAPVVLVAAAPNVLVVNPQFPVQSVKELIALARQRPGGINYASAGLGTSNHLTVELLQVMTGVQFNHVPYKGDAPGTADVVAGQVPMIFPTLPVALPFIKAGKLRPIAVSSAVRSSLLPDVPTVAESGGLPEFEVSVWVGILAPAGTPKEIVNRLNTEIVKIVRMPNIGERLAGLGAEPVGDTSEHFAAYIGTELAKWSKVAKAAGITPN
jgi:tripartite-type tricarboxylate transporter receptor subunit TctC